MPDYHARVITNPFDSPAQGGTMAQILFHAPGERGLLGAWLPLPGVGPPPNLAPSGLAVARVDDERGR